MRSKDTIVRSVWKWTPRLASLAALVVALIMIYDRFFPTNAELSATITFDRQVYPTTICNCSAEPPNGLWLAVIRGNSKSTLEGVEIYLPGSVLASITRDRALDTAFQNVSGKILIGSVAPNEVIAVAAWTIQSTANPKTDIWLRHSLGVGEVKLFPDAVFDLLEYYETGLILFGVLCALAIAFFFGWAAYPSGSRVSNGTGAQGEI